MVNPHGRPVGVAQQESVAGKVILLDTCGHTTVFRMATLTLFVGDPIICTRCNTSRLVAAIDDEYRVRCTVCTYSRGFGIAGVSASMAAVRHARDKQHRTEVHHGRKTTETYPGRMAGQATLDELEDIPPF